MINWFTCETCSMGICIWFLQRWNIWHIKFLWLLNWFNIYWPVSICTYMYAIYLVCRYFSNIYWELCGNDKSCLCRQTCVPGVGLWPKIPLYIAGRRTEPATSEPTPITDAPEAISAAFKKINLKELVECYILKPFFSVNVAYNKHCLIKDSACW